MERPSLEAFHQSERFSDIRLIICTGSPVSTTLSSSFDSDYSQPASPQSFPLQNWAAAETSPPKVLVNSTVDLHPSSLVQELPAHKLVLAAASDFFAQLMEIQDPKQITLQVDPSQVEAAKALTHHMYHAKLPADLTPKGVATVLQLAERYQMSGCVEDCSAQLCEAMANSKGGNNIAPVLEVCNLLTVLGHKTATDKLFAFFKDHRQLLQRSLSVLKPGAVPIIQEKKKVNFDDNRAATREEDKSFARAVSVLQLMFKEMERVWVQAPFRDVLAVFPLCVIQGLLSWDELFVRSENIVVMAAHHWLQAQSRASKADTQALLSVIRTPYCTFSFLQGILPHIEWARHCRDFDERLCYGSFAAAAPGRYRSAFSQKLVPETLRDMMTPRFTDSARSLVEVDWEVPVTKLLAARHSAERTSSGMVEIQGPAAWCNGFQFVPVVVVCAEAEKSVTGHVLYGGIRLEHVVKHRRKGRGSNQDQWPAVCVNLGRMNFSLVDASESCRVWLKNFGDRVDVLAGNEVLGGGLWQTYPEDVEELVKRGCMVHCAVQIIDME